MTEATYQPYVCDVCGSPLDVDDGALFCVECDQNPPPNVWVVGRATDLSGRWEFMGAFDDEDAARDACTTLDDFVGPAVLNRRVPDPTETWPNAYYPLASVQRPGTVTERTDWTPE